MPTSDLLIPAPTHGVGGLARISQVAGIGYWSVNLSDKHVRWSAELRTLHGLAEHDPLPSRREWLERHVHPDDRARARDMLDHWLSGGVPVLEHGFRLLRVDGTVRDVLSYSLAEDNHGHDLRFGVLIDVTSLRRTQAALSQAEGRAALTASAVGMGTWEVDLNTGEVFWDTPMWLLRGLAPRPQPLSYEERIALVHPDDRARMREINLGNSTPSYDFRILWPDGSVHWLASRATTLHDDQGRPTRRIGVNWDITAHREAETALREQEIALRESQTRSRTLARMSHELRTPLNAILGCTQLLQADSSDTGLRQRRLAEIEAAGRQLLQLVDQVLDLTGRGDDAAAALPPPAAAPDPGRRRTLLYIEDNSVNAMIVSELVARRGDLDVAIAETGQAGLEQAARLQPSLVLLDMQLPDMDGSEVFRRLRADGRTSHLPCIALSANAMQSDIDAALAAGMTAYWTKPLDFRAFAQSLESLFGPAPRVKT